MLAAGSAFAAGETLSFLGASGNAASIVAADPTASSSALRGLTYGLRVSGLSGSNPIMLQELTGPTSSSLYAERVSGNVAPAADPAFTQVATSITAGAAAAVGATTVTLSGTPGTALSNTLVRFGTSGETYIGSSTGATLTLTTPLRSAVASGATVNGGGASTTPVFQQLLASGTGSAPLPSYTTGDNLYVGASTAGTYTFRVFSDVNADGTYQSNTDDATPTFTLTVKSPADAFALSAPSSVVAGATGTKATVTPSVDVTDIRGGSPSALGTALAGALSIGITDNGSGGGGVLGENSTGAPTYTTADGIYRYLSTSSGATALTLDAGTPHTLGSALSFNSVAVTGATKTTEVVSNSVSTLPLVVKAGQTDNVLTGSGTATVRVGTGSVTYTATAKDSSGAVLANKDVLFTLGAGSGTTLANLTANGAAVPTTGASAGQVTVTTDGDGVATLKVTSTSTANNNSYTVAASSGTASGTTITTTYQTTAVTTVTSSNVAAVVGGTAILSGKVVDQFGQPYSASGLTAALAVTGGATPASGNYPIGSDGKFSATVNDTTSNTTPRNDSFTWTVSGVSSGSKTLAWRTSITPGAVGIATTTIAGSSTDTAIPFTSTTTRVDVANSGAFTGDVETVKGTVTDTATTPAVLPFASVTYTGSDGVLFYDADNKLSKTMTASATSAGKLSYDGSTDGIRVLFTKAGDATITAKSGSVTKTVTVPVEIATDAYKVTATDVRGKPGNTVTVSGTVTDAFGNPATGRSVTLALSSSSAGTLTGTDGNGTIAGFQVVTDDQGVWSTPFTTTSNQSGSVTLTATLSNAANTAVLTANPTANAAYATAGQTVADGDYQDEATIKIGVDALTIHSSSQLTYGSKYYARGALVSGENADALANVDVYSKLPGGSYALIDSVKADDKGNFSATEKISKSTYFLVKSGGASSTAAATHVISGVILTAKSGSKGHVTLSANGGPNAKAYLYFYRVFSNGDTDYLGKKLSSASGNGEATVKAPKGNRKYKVLFKAPGTTTGSDTVSVKVK